MGYNDRSNKEDPMFNKHEFTCPDIIYLRKRQRKINIATLVGVVGLSALSYGYAWWEERKNPLENLEFTEEDVTPTDA